MQYLSTTSAAQVTDFSRKWIFQQIKEGKLRAHNVAPAGSRPRYRIAEDDLKAFMDQFAPDAVAAEAVTA